MQEFNVNHYTKKLNYTPRYENEYVQIYKYQLRRNVHKNFKNVTFEEVQIFFIYTIFLSKFSMKIMSNLSVKIFLHLLQS